MATQALSTFSSLYPAQRETINEIQELYNKKLWHNITLVLQSLVKQPGLESHDAGKELHQLYNNFISQFESKLNSLSLAEIVVAITRKSNNPVETIEFLESVSKRLSENKNNSEAIAILKTEIAVWRLRTHAFQQCRDILREVKDLIEKSGHVDNTVNSAYYKAYAEYLKLTEDPNEFYKNALLHLAYTPIENITHIEQQAMAYDLGIAALLGDNIYNFGELLGHPVIDSLKGSQAEWLLKILFAFNRGDIQEYQKQAEAFSSLQVLQTNKNFLIEKLQLMAVMELVFNRPADNRIIPFKDVSDATGVPLDRVEPLLLKSLAYSLIRGVIDEVSGTIRVTWAQPRVLDKSQITNLREKIGTWLGKVDHSLEYLQDKGTNEITAA